MPISSENSLIMIRRLSKTIFITASIFSSVVAVPSIVINIYIAFLKPVIAQFNLCSAFNRHTKRHSQYSKYSCTFNLIFTQNLIYFLFGSFFRILKIRTAHQNTTNLFIYQKHTDSPKWLILSKYAYNSHVY